MNYTVSIFILTYNQEQYIAQTIESILNQETTFPIQLVIGEDRSSDKTRAICEEFVRSYGDKIKLLPSPQKNMGLISNYMRTIKECDGKYIAICDGDDYWTDSLKLQKQVDFLEQNQEYNIVHTNLKLLLTDGSFEEVLHHKKNYSLSTFADLIENNTIYSVTAMFRNIQKYDALPSWILKYPYGDLPTYLWTLKNEGKIYCLEDITAVYRLNIGVASKLVNQKEIVKSILKDAYEDINFKNKRKIFQKHFYYQKCFEIVKLNRQKKYSKAFFKLIRVWIITPTKLNSLRVYLSSLKKELF